MNAPVVIKVPIRDLNALTGAVQAMIDRVSREGPALRRAARAEDERAFAVDHMVDRLEEALNGVVLADRRPTG